MDTPEGQNQTPLPEPAAASLPHQSLTGGPVFHPQPPPVETNLDVPPETASEANPTPATTLQQAAVEENSSPLGPSASTAADDQKAPASLNTKVVQTQSSTPENTTVNIADSSTQTTSKSSSSANLTSPAPVSPADSPQNVRPPDNKITHISSKSSFAIAIVATVFLTMIGIGGLIFFARKNSGQSAQWFGNPQKKQADQNLSDSGAGQIANLPDGYQVVSRSCFQLGAPQTSIVSAERGCLLLASSPAPQYLNFSVTPSTEKNGGLIALGAATEKNSDTNLLKLTSTADTTVGGSSAKRLNFTTSSGINQVKIVVIPPKPSYLQDNTPITSFEISYSYKTDDEKARAESVLSTWNWK